MLSRPLLLLLSAVCLFHTLAAAQQPESMTDVEITYISGCVDVYPVTVNCSVATTTLFIQTAAGFPSSVFSFGYWLYVDLYLGNHTYFTTSTAWLNPDDATNTSAFVNVSARAYYPHITDQLISVSFIDYWSVGAPTSVPFAGFSYRFEGPPTLTSIAGCEGSGQSTLNCVPDATVLELTGSGLLWYSQGYNAVLNIGDATSTLLSTSVLQVINDTYAVLTLEWIYSSMLKPQHYAGVLLSLNITSIAYGRMVDYEYSFTTNTLFLSFVPLPLPVVTQWYHHALCSVCLCCSNPVVRPIRISCERR